MESTDFKICTKCLDSLPLGNYYKDIKGKDGLRSYCKACLNKASCDYAKENRESYRVSSKRYYEKSRAVVGAKVKPRTPGSPDEVKARRAEGKKQWRNANPHKMTAYKRQRRGVERRATPVWAEDEWELFLMSEIYALARLRTKMTGASWHVDHIVPLKSDVVCGLHCSSNLAVIPARINLLKGNKHGA